MTQFDNTDLEFRFKPNWGFVLGKCFALFVVALYCGIQLAKNESKLPFGMSDWLTGLPASVVLVSFFAISLALLLLETINSFRKLNAPKSLLINSQRLKLPKKRISADDEIINFRDIYHVIEKKSWFRRSLVVNYDQGRYRIDRNRLQDEQSFLDLSELIRKFHSTHHAAAVLQEIEKERKIVPESPARTA